MDRFILFTFFFAQCYSMCEGQVPVLNVNMNLWSNQWSSYFIRSVVVNCMHYTNQLHGDIILKSQKNKDHIFCTKVYLSSSLTVTQYSVINPRNVPDIFIARHLWEMHTFCYVEMFLIWNSVTFLFCSECAKYRLFFLLNRSKEVSDVHCSFPK